MATQTVTAPNTPKVAYNDGTEAPIDQLNRLSIQLEALLTTVTGEGFDSFARYSDEVQQNVLWMAYGMAQQIRIVVNNQIDRELEVSHG